MRRATLLACVLPVSLLLLPALAAAGGFNLAWGTGCWADNPVARTLFACNTNAGSASMVASFVPPADMAGFVALSGIVDGQTEAATLPDWWQLFNPGACRSAALGASADFTSAGGGCADPWIGLATGGVAAWETQLFPPPPPANVPGPRTCRLRVTYSLINSSTISGGTEYYGFRATVSNLKTVGIGSCAGCATGMSFVLNSLRICDNRGNCSDIVTPVSNYCLSWNTNVNPCYVQVLAARNRTWGEVQSLYR